MPTSALDVYQSVQRVAASGRQLEATLLFKAARQLDTVMKEWGADDRAATLDAALRYNTQLWSIFQASMQEADSPLPLQLRLNILRLTRYIDQRTLDIYKAPAPEKLQPLIDINRRIAAGLSAVTAPPAPPLQQQTA